MEMSTGVSLLRTAQSLLTGRTILSRNVDQKSIEAVFSIANCRPSGDKWQSKTPFLSIFDLCSSILDNVFDCRLPGVLHMNQE